MKTGFVFPHPETGTDPAAIKDLAQAVEQLGFTHILAYDHVVGADPDREGGWTGPYTKDTPFREPLVTFAYMAAVTTTLEFTTGIIILPQRQTALFAKQAADLDLLSGGRLRSGSGQVGTPSSTKPWDRISTPAGAARRSRCACFAASGPRRSSTSTAGSTPSAGRASIRGPSAGFRSGSAGEAS